MRIILVSKCSLYTEQYVEFKLSVLISPSKSLISSRWVTYVLSKVVKNIIFQNKTLLVMFCRHNKTFWYQFCNFKHFLKAENSEDSLASSCEEFCIT